MKYFKEIHDLDEYQAAISSKCIILFTADWCPDCMFIKPFIDDLALCHPEFKYYYINRDHMLDLCKKLDVIGIPSFIGYDQGKEIGRFVSKLRKTRNEIEKFIDSIK